MLMREQIEAMTDAEVNVCIAESAMAWHKKKLHDKRDWWLSSDDGAQRFVDSFKPSESLNDAMLAAEKVGLTRSIPPDADGSGYDLQFRLVWLGNLWVAGWGWQEDPAGQVSARMCGSNPSPARAICNAVIAANEMKTT